jgi:transcriptional regulator with XRE-family HTH domain
MESGPLARLRALGLTQVELAQLLGVAQSTISQWTTGDRQIPALMVEDLWELLRLVEEEIAAGMDIHEAVQGWGPTVRFSPGGQTRIGAEVTIPRDVAEDAAKEGPEATERLVAAEAMAELVKLWGNAKTAKQWARIRRLLLALKIHADSELRLMEREGSHAHHGQGERPKSRGGQFSA